MDWTIFDATSDGGESNIAVWILKERITKRDVGQLNQKIDMLQLNGPELPPKLLSGPIKSKRNRKLVSHVYKLIIHGDRMLRPMLCKGPINMTGEFTLLLGAIEVGGVLDTDSEQAEVVRSNILRNPKLRNDAEYAEGYAESFLDSYVATQIKVLREQAGLSQHALAEQIGTKQGVVSRIENVNYSKWNVSTLKKLARAFRVRLKVSFESYGSLLHDVAAFSRTSLQREPRERDSVLLNGAALNLFTDRRRIPLRKSLSREPGRSMLSPHVDQRLMPGAHNAEFGVLRSRFAAPASAAELSQRAAG